MPHLYYKNKIIELKRKYFVYIIVLDDNYLIHFLQTLPVLKFIF